MAQHTSTQLALQLSTLGIFFFEFPALDHNAKALILWLSTKTQGFPLFFQWMQRCSTNALVPFRVALAHGAPSTRLTNAAVMGVRSRQLVVVSTQRCWPSTLSRKLFPFSIKADLLDIWTFFNRHSGANYEKDDNDNDK